VRTTITDEQRQELGNLVEGTICRIESADFLPQSGIRFPQNPCSRPWLLRINLPQVSETTGEDKVLRSVAALRSLPL
jgi:hypothetical protein